MFKKYQNLINTFRILADIVIIILSFFIAYFVRFNTQIFGVGEISYRFIDYAVILVLIIPINIIGYKVCGFYDSLRTKKFASQLRNTFIVNMLSVSIVFIYLFVTKNNHYSRLLLLGFFILSYCISMAFHLIVKKALNRMRVMDKNLKYVVVIGAGRLGKEYSNKIVAHKEYGYAIAAFFDDNESLIGKTVNDTKIIGKTDALKEYLEHNVIDLLVIALPNSCEEIITNVINISELHGVKSQIIPDYYHILPAKPSFDEIDGLPLLHTRFVPLDKWVNKAIKRAVDLIASSIGLLLLSPLFLLVSLIIKFTSPGPIVYRQPRVGYNRKHFDMFKFRSMKYEKDAQPGWTTKNDSRTTKFGEFMRANNIDELLQLVNVFIGDMTLVGPRPEQPAFVKQFMYEIPKYMIKHHVKPGMTGWAQVNGWRGDTSIEERIKCDIYYIENWTIGFDFKIMLKTIYSGKKNAY
jgi:Undecaprenyl-phosphate glucose phosphotransferase